MTQGPGLQCLEKEARPLVLEKGMSSARASFQIWDKFVTENKQGTKIGKNFFLCLHTF